MDKCCPLFSITTVFSRQQSHSASSASRIQALEQGAVVLLIPRAVQDRWRARGLLPQPLCQPLTGSGAEAFVVLKQFLIINQFMPKLRQVAWGLYVGCIVGCLTDTTTHCKGVTCIFCFQFCNQGSIKAPNIHFVVSLLYSKVLLVSLVTETETGRLAEILLSPAQLQPQGLHFFLSFLF